MDPKSRECLWSQALSFVCCCRHFQELRLYFTCTTRVLSEMLLVSGKSKNKAAPQGRMSWGQRVRTTQAVSLPTKAQSKASVQRTEEGTDNKVYGQSQTRQSNQSDVGSNWRVQSGVAGDKTGDSYTSHIVEARTEGLVQV